MTTGRHTRTNFALTTHTTTPPHSTLDHLGRAMGFKDILDWLRANDMGDLAIRVAEMGIDDMDSLRAMDLTTFQEHGLDHLSTRRIWECLHGPDILVIHESETVTSRPDLPVVHARGRGSMKRALDRTITNDEDQLIIDLENDMYAQSSKKPREALWKTWCVMASAWNLPPVPLTEELILKVGASFKAGQYRSPQNYFSRAVQEHRSLTKANPSYFLQQLIKNTTRSIVRGMGPTPFKDSFEVELLCRICPYNLPTGQETWVEDPAAKIDATLICCWWLLRGIEAAAATTLHVWHQTTATEKTTFLTLPVQKTDSAGACVARGHSCICQSARHFQRICSHHAMKRHLDRMLRRFPAQYRLPQGMPLIPNASGHTISQDQLIQIFRDTIQLDRNHHGKTRPSWRSQATILPTHMPCVRSTIPYPIGLLTWGSPTHWPLGIRCHQTLHPRSPIATPTCSQAQGTSSNRDDKPASPDPRPTRSPSSPTSVLDLQPNDQGLRRQPFSKTNPQVDMMRGQPSMSTDLLKHLQEAGIRPDHAIVGYLTHIGLISDIAFVEFKPRYSRTRRVVRQIQSRNHIWRQQDWPHWRRPTRCAQSIPHRHTQVHHQETRLYLASRTSNHRHHSPQRHHVEGLRRQSTQGPTTRDLRRPSRSIQQNHHQRTATNIPRKAPLGSREDHCQDVARTC